MSDLNVYQRLNECKKIVAMSTFEKRKSDGLKFAYLPMETIQPVVEDAMNGVGLVLIPGELRTKNVREPWDQASSGGFGVTRWYHIEGELPITWVNIDNPSDTIKMSFKGEAKDNSDKVISKLYTAIMKSAYKAIFNISTDRKDDPDNTEDEKRREDEAEAKAKAERDRKTMESDPFFKKKDAIVTEAPKETTEADVTIAPADVPATEITTDRPIEEMVASIIKYNRQVKLRPIIKACAEKWGADPTFWTESQVKECYKKCIEGGRS